MPVPGSDRPLLVSPALATAVGLEGAVFLQQLHYWTERPGAHERDGFRWVYNTLDQWLAQFPFWSRSALHRVIAALEAKGAVVSSASYNAKGSDRTKWYRIAYDHPAIGTLFPTSHIPNSGYGNTEASAVNPGNGNKSRIRDMDDANPEFGISISRNRDLLKEHKTTTETTTENDTPLPPTGGSAGRSTKKARETSWPDGFALTPALRETAIRAGIRRERIDAVFDQFRDRALAKDIKYVSWPHGWSTWVNSPYQDRDRERQPPATPGAVERGKAPKDGGLAAFRASGRTP